MAQLNFSDIFNMNQAYLASNLTMASIVTNIAVTLVVAALIYWIYKKTFTGVIYSKNFNITLIMVSMVTSLAVMAISGNLALSLGMVGALSIVRFRSPIKDPKDLGFLFWSVTNGIICGVGAFKLALVSTIAVGVVVFVLSKRFQVQHPYLLILHSAGINKVNLEGMLKRTCARYHIRSSTLTDEKDEMTIEVRLHEKDTAGFLKQVKALGGIKKAMLVSYAGDLEEV